MTEPYILAVGVNEMFVDRTYQRDLDERRTLYMSKNWDARLVGVLEVSDRGEGSHPHRYAVVGGQHRWAAASLVSSDINLVCRVHTDLTPENEAALMLALENEQKQMNSWDKWKARKRSGDRVVIQIEQTVELAGLRVTIGPEPTYVMCIAVLERLYQQSGTALIRDVLMTLTDVWPRSKDALRAQVVAGLGFLLDLYGDDLDDGRLADAMSELTPGQVLARGKEHKVAFPSLTMPQAVASILINAYNAQPGRGRLASVPAKMQEITR